MRYGHGHALYDQYQEGLGRLLAYDDRPASREEFADDPEPCDGSGEIGFNKSWGKEPWNDDSMPCPGCPNCEPEDDDE